MRAFTIAGVLALSLIGLWWFFVGQNNHLANVPSHDAHYEKDVPSVKSSSVSESADKDAGNAADNRFDRAAQTLPHVHQTEEHDHNGPVFSDQLSPQVRQSLQQGLLLEGDAEPINTAEGTVILLSSGRATQMTVAVQRPDGTIEIRELSELPAKRSESTAPPAQPKYRLSEPIQ